MTKYIYAEKLIAEIDSILSACTKQTHTGVYNTCHRIKGIINSLQQEQTDIGEISDGYHTFNELYYYRMLYNAAFFNLLPKEWVHKSKKHYTGEECFGGGWFIERESNKIWNVSYILLSNRHGWHLSMVLGYSINGGEMIHTRLRYFVTCDKCGKTIETNAANEAIANREAERKGWKCVVTYSYGGAYHPPVYTNYCPKCKETEK